MVLPLFFRLYLVLFEGLREVQQLRESSLSLVAAASRAKLLSNHLSNPQRSEDETPYIRDVKKDIVPRRLKAKSF